MDGFVILGHIEGGQLDSEASSNHSQALSLDRFGYSHRTNPTTFNLVEVARHSPAPLCETVARCLGLYLLALRT